MINERIGKYAYKDVLVLKDLSSVTGKKHSLKIELPKTKEKQFIEIEGENPYEDIGVREINHWMQQSPLGTHKIVIIENIERIVPAAANAFLKSLEEPLPNRLVIATVSHASQMLDTIFSRALVLRFQELSFDEIKKFAQERSLFAIDQEFQNFACSMAMGRPGVLVNLYESLSDDEELQKNFQKLVKLMSQDGSLFKKQDILKQLHASGALDTFLDGWIAYCTVNNMPEQGSKRLEIKKMINNNVNIEHLLVYGVM